LIAKDLGFKLIDNVVHWCLNSNPKNNALKKNKPVFEKTHDLLSKAENEVKLEEVVEEPEKPLDDLI